jgi:hypothetical protein
MPTRARELDGLKSWIVAHRDYDARASELLKAIDAHLTAVRTTAADTGNGRIKRLWRGLTGASFERTLANL